MTDKPQPSALAALQRYAIEAHAIFGTPVAEALERDWGEYVRWNDVLAAWPTQAQEAVWVCEKIIDANEDVSFVFRHGDKLKQRQHITENDGPAWIICDAICQVPSAPKCAEPSTAALREALDACLIFLDHFGVTKKLKGNDAAAIERARTLLAGDSRG